MGVEVTEPGDLLTAILCALNDMDFGRGLPIPDPEAALSKVYAYRTGAAQRAADAIAAWVGVEVAA